MLQFRQVRANIEWATRLQSETRTLIKRSSKLGLEFLKADLDIGLLFAQIALDAGIDSEKQSRNRVMQG